MFGSPPVDPEVEVLDLPGEIGGFLELDGEIWLTSYEPPAGGDREGSTDLIRIDVSSGDMAERLPFGVGLYPGRLTALGDSFYTGHVGELPAIPSVALHGFEYFDDDGEPHYLVRFDRSSGELVAQYQYPAVGGVVDDQFGVFGSRIYVFGWTGIWSIDPETELSGEVSSQGGRDVQNLRIDGKYLWIVSSSWISKVDIETGERVFGHGHGDLERSTGQPGGAFRYHDGHLWVSGWEWDDPDHAYEYDPITGQVSNPSPIAEVPARSFESGGFRWDLYRVVLPGPSLYFPDYDDTWNQVDLRSGETIERYDFGSYSPEFVLGGFMWLSGRDDAGRSRLARVALD